ncbi:MULTISPECIES: 4a-hydroxytetrahydrobiopterin dehydratase [Streptomyces]|uniref:Putative pterin-4-alpha-carbinolamine dehydratase n=1 Tax=Streptomyces katrae TaxID=68223 RepID=A0ABT7H7T8_9ACTN|nr:MULTISPECIES: 4a-hydroxytetrahydrobiopterin dehydratase [Streptomyces]MDK9501494.1 4a-hydroxytetrahydrobiopterin dehydratase [Streptomyces katrae]RSS99454.1 4a-hydroxytetrahydrobiopterin dehydratase [Streptomyces sp. WAC07149]GLX19436.1 putative pterin-4-alpha-carbinolamine dehydratase [Streptomyces lavendulae subsp. lavendulae]GLX31082.1 putative pterin-4-alpha-carbinolamine dehydratase [Streptomyces lavendulae subsp. lavendulae]
MGVPMVLNDEQIAENLAGLPGWERKGDEITRTYEIRYHAAVAAIVTIADRSRRIQHHADLDLRIDHLRATITTHDAGHRLTAADFDLAHRIDAIVAAHQALPLA